MASSQTSSQAGTQLTCDCCGATIEVVKPCTCSGSQGKPFRCSCGSEMKPKS